MSGMNGGGGFFVPHQRRSSRQGTPPPPPTPSQQPPPPRRPLPPTRHGRVGAGAGSVPLHCESLRDLDLLPFAKGTIAVAAAPAAQSSETTSASFASVTAESSLSRPLPSPRRSTDRSTTLWQPEEEPLRRGGQAREINMRRVQQHMGCIRSSGGNGENSLDNNHHLHHNRRQHRFPHELRREHEKLPTARPPRRSLPVPPIQQARMNQDELRVERRRFTSLVRRLTEAAPAAATAPPPRSTDPRRLALAAPGAAFPPPGGSRRVLLPSGPPTAVPAPKIYVQILRGEAAAAAAAKSEAGDTRGSGEGDGDSDDDDDEVQILSSLPRRAAAIAADDEIPRKEGLPPPPSTSTATAEAASWADRAPADQEVSHHPGASVVDLWHRVRPRQKPPFALPPLPGARPPLNTPPIGESSQDVISLCDVDNSDTDGEGPQSSSTSAGTTRRRTPLSVVESQNACDNHATTGRGSSPETSVKDASSSSSSLPLSYRADRDADRAPTRPSEGTRAQMSLWDRPPHRRTSRSLPLSSSPDGAAPPDTTRRTERRPILDRHRSSGNPSPPSPKESPTSTSRFRVDTSDESDEDDAFAPQTQAQRGPSEKGAREAMELVKLISIDRVAHLPPSTAHRRSTLATTPGLYPTTPSRDDAMAATDLVDTPPAKSFSPVDAAIKGAVGAASAVYGWSKSLIISKHNSKQNPGTSKARPGTVGKPIRPGASLETRSPPSPALRRSERLSPSSTSSGESSHKRSSYFDDFRCALEAPAKRLRTRSQTRRQPQEPETIEIDDDEDDDEMKEADHSQYSKSKRVTEHPVNQTRIEMDVLRIALGKKVFASGCRIEADTKSNVFELFFRKDPGRTRSDPAIDVHCLFTVHEVQEFKYYQPDRSLSYDDNDDDAEDPPIFFAFQAVPTVTNGLKQYSNSFDGLSDRKKYVTVEFREAAELRHLLDHLRGSKLWQAFITPGAQLTSRGYEPFAKALLLDSKKEAESRRHALSSSSVKSTKDTLTSGPGSGEILLVYPFAGDPAAIEQAAEGLTEAKGQLLDLDLEALPADSTSGDEAETEEPAKYAGRGHFLTVRVQDYERLEPGEYLNDTIIDFWMQWMARHNDRTKFHVFSSHFYTALKDKGPDGVTNWTKNKNINVFEKEMIFIPINETLHWSLCVVVNPGSICNAYNDDLDTDPWPGMYFFDSLKAHRKTVVAANVRSWLNAEYRRLCSADEASMLNQLLQVQYNYRRDWKKLPYNPSTMKVESPTVPYQNNGWDCGVFVCRYAYAMFELAKSERFLYGTDKRAVVTNSPQFRFGMRDIARIREELKTLVRRLAKVYRPWRDEEDRKERQEKVAAREAKALAAATATTASAPSQAGDASEEPPPDATNVRSGAGRQVAVASREAADSRDARATDAQPRWVSAAAPPAESTSSDVDKPSAHWQPLASAGPLPVQREPLVSSSPFGPPKEAATSRPPPPRDSTPDQVDDDLYPGEPLGVPHPRLRSAAASLSSSSSSPSSEEEGDEEEARPGSCSPPPPPQRQDAAPAAGRGAAVHRSSGDPRLRPLRSESV